MSKLHPVPTPLTRDALVRGQLKHMIRQAPELLPYLMSEAQLQASLQKTLTQHPKAEDVWVFAYGSLIWNPILDYGDRKLGQLHGWHRCFCLQTPAGRGTPDCPGLVLGLDRGGSCRGVTYRVAAEQAEAELLLLWHREMIVGSYIPRWVKVRTEQGTVPAIAFVINPDHPSYAPKLDLPTVVDRIATAQGPLGSSADYMLQTVAGLEQWGIRDRQLLRIRDRVLGHPRFQSLAQQNQDESGEAAAQGQQ